MSAFKKAESRDTLVVRVFNTADEDTAASLRVFFPVKAVYHANLAEEREGEMAPEDGQAEQTAAAVGDGAGRGADTAVKPVALVRFPVGPKEIVTLELVF